jgi:hypothetical protein
MGSDCCGGGAGWTGEAVAWVHWEMSGCISRSGRTELGSKGYDGHIVPPAPGMRVSPLCHRLGRHV